MIAVIQAGGKGARLRPYTMVLPKPLMPVGSQPVLELLLKWLRRNGTHDVYITTGHLGHLIRTVCSDGRQWDLNICYTEEAQPLGTIGALTLLKGKINSTFLVINGDVLTDLSINAFTAFHRQHNGLLSITVAKRNVKIDFGVIEQQANLVTRFIEKPLLSQIVSTGIYCLEPEVLELIPNGIPFGFDDLMHCMLGKKLPVHTFLHNGLWLDIGRVEDFHQAQELAWEDLTPSVEMVVA